MFTEYVKITSEGKDYIGRIVSIQSEWDAARTIMGKWKAYPILYTVTLMKKGTYKTYITVCIPSLSEIQPYEVEE